MARPPAGMRGALQASCLAKKASSQTVSDVEGVMHSDTVMRSRLARTRFTHTARSRATSLRGGKLATTALEDEMDLVGVAVPFMLHCRNELPSIDAEAVELSLEGFLGHIGDIEIHSLVFPLHDGHL